MHGYGDRVRIYFFQVSQRRGKTKISHLRFFFRIVLLVCMSFVDTQLFLSYSDTQIHSFALLFAPYLVDRDVVLWVRRRLEDRELEVVAVGRGVLQMPHPGEEFHEFHFELVQGGEGEVFAGGSALVLLQGGAQRAASKAGRTLFLSRKTRRVKNAVGLVGLGPDPTQLGSPERRWF